jgi:hypothetical protein
VTRRELLALLACGRPASGSERAPHYLWTQQSPDGGWHSTTYGLLRSGQSLTPFVLEALLRLPSPPGDRVERAVRFLAQHINTDGALGLANPLLSDYPNYATALTVQAFVRRGRDVTRLVRYLRQQQFSEENGWSPDHPAYGAWGMGGGEPPQPPHLQHVDLSMTRHVLEALATAGATPKDPALQQAQVFLDRCRNVDGGFHFTTVVLEANKAGPDGSYGTPTADGILSLQAIGASPDAPRRWLRTHHRTDVVPGFAAPVRQRWAQGLRFYYAAAVAAAAPELPVTPLLGAQRPDGSFVNSEPIVKEDDPLIATAFALRAFHSEG